MPTERDNRLAPDKDDHIYPQVSIGLLHELGARTSYNSWSRINGLLHLGEDGHKAVLGRKPDRRNGYPLRFSKETYRDALDAIALDYQNALDPVELTKRYLDEAGVRIKAIDAVFDEKAATAFEQWDALADGWWEAVKNALYCSFEYDNRSTRTPKTAGSVTLGGRGGSPADEGQTLAPLRLVKALLFGEAEDGVLPDGGRPLVPALPLDDAAFVERLFPPGFASFAEERLGCGPAALVDRAPDAALAFAVYEHFSCDQGLRFRAMAQRCKPFMAAADGPAFFERADLLFHALEARASRSEDVRASRSAFLRCADGRAGRGLAFLLLASLVGFDNPRLLARVAQLPEARKR